jgi:cobyrinic acid a,c-diamide synthase
VSTVYSIMAKVQSGFRSVCATSAVEDKMFNFIYIKNVQMLTRLNPIIYFKTKS